MINLHSDKVPEIEYQPEIEYLFGFFAFNWSTLMPVISLLIGIGLGFFVAKKIKENF